MLLVCADYPYVHHVLRSMQVDFKEPQRAWVEVAESDAGVVNALFRADLSEENMWWDSPHAYKVEPASGLVHTGLYCVVEREQQVALERFAASLAIQVTCTAYPWSDDRSMVVLDCSPLTARWALALQLKNLGFKPRGESAIAKPDPQMLCVEIHKTRTKRNHNIRCPWRRQLQALLEKVNRSSNERQLFKLFESALEAIEKKIVFRGPMDGSLQQQHAALTYEMLNQVCAALPRQRNTTGVPSQLLAECVVDRPDQQRFSNLDSETMVLTYGPIGQRTGVTVSGPIQRLVAVRKKLDLWEACNRRLFIDPRGLFFRDDSRLRAWMYNYRKRSRT